VREEAAKGFERPKEAIALSGRMIEFFGGPHKWHTKFVLSEVVECEPENAPQSEWKDC